MRSDTGAKPTIFMFLFISVQYVSNHYMSSLSFPSWFRSKATFLKASNFPIFLSNKWDSEFYSRDLFVWSRFQPVSPNFHPSTVIFFFGARLCAAAATWLLVDSYFILWNCQLVLQMKALLSRSSCCSAGISQSFARMMQNISHIRLWNRARMLVLFQSLHRCVLSRVNPASCCIIEYWEEGGFICPGVTVDGCPS